MAALKPVGVNTTLSTSGTSAQTIAIAQQCDAIRVAVEGAGVYVAIGTNPTATSTDYYVTTAEPEVISIGIPAAQRVVGITTGTKTILDFPEGTGCPFAIGDAVSLTVSDVPNFNFEHKILSDVNTTSSIGGYFSTRVTIDHDSSSVTDVYNQNNWAQLRKSIKVAVKTNSGTGTAFIQQVQDS